MQSERKHGLSTEQFPVSAYGGSSKNLKDLQDVPMEDVLVWMRPATWLLSTLLFKVAIHLLLGN